MRTFYNASFRRAQSPHNLKAQPVAIAPTMAGCSPGPRSWEPGFLEAFFPPRGPPKLEQQQPVAPSQGPSFIAGLNADCLAAIFGCLPPGDLARVQAVCRAWRDLARAAEVIRTALMASFQLKSLFGEPRSWAVAEFATIKSMFVKRHVVERSDTLATLAVRYDTDVPSLKRLNNMTTEYTLHSRTHIYIPVNSLESIAGHHASFVFCALSCRELIMLHSADDTPGQGQATSSTALSLSTSHQDQVKAKMAKLLCRSLRIDEQTASYYLSEAEGDMRKAMQMAGDDQQWEQHPGNSSHNSSTTRGRLVARGCAANPSFWSRLRYQA